jgi:cation diffusion facilitator family transporter
MSARSKLVRRGFHLSVFTVVWNIVEGIVGIVSGLMSGSVALLGFGIDSFVESASAIIVGWRFSYEMSGQPQEKAEKAESWAAHITGILLLILAAYLLVDSGRRLLGFGPEPESSRVGIALTFVSLMIMPVLARAKLKTAALLESKALRADSYQTIACAWLSLTTLVGLALNAALGWWWADPASALLLVPLIVREGLEGFRPEDD